MLKLVLVAAAALAGGGFVWGQTAKALSFEVASVKPAAPCCAPGQWRESKVGEDRIDFRYVTVRYCIAAAYRLKEYQVTGPAWINEARFDIVAKASEGTRREQLPEMIQTLLAERFKLEVHREKKEFNVFTLVVGKNGPKLKESPLETENQGGANFGISMTGAGVGRLEARRADMTALSNTLPRFVGRPVVNLTELSGRFDFELEFSPEDLKGMRTDLPAATAASAEFGMSIFTSIQKVGLKLEPQKLPLDTIVVDRGEKTPIEN
jgi:uncharacterized protein (TIGR03435 family)